jgi:glycosyltransferase involved in cell wall biosynthesis
MSDAKILFIGQGAADVTAGGGARRTYQLLYELRRAFGPERVAFCTFGDLRTAPASAGEWIGDAAAHLAVRARKVAENRAHLFYKSGFSALSRKVARAYRARLETLPRLQICIVEDPNLAQLRYINDAAGIRTILAPWCLNALTQYLPPLVRGLNAARARADTLRDRAAVRAAFAFQGDEVMLHARAERSWMLSQVEQGFLRSLGLPAEYVPFYPVGDAMTQLQDLRRRRSVATIDPGLFVISGSPIHQNNLALAELLASLDLERLDAGVRIAVTGFDRRQIDFSRYASAKVQFLGRLDNAAFGDLLVKACAVLVPQIAGFGCLTRILEMLAAGIPVLADAMTTSATGPMPGAIYVAPGETRWPDAIKAMDGGLKEIPLALVEPWLAAARQQAMAALHDLRLR